MHYQEEGLFKANAGGRMRAAAPVRTPELSRAPNRLAACNRSQVFNNIFQDIADNTTTNGQYGICWSYTAIMC